MNTSYQYTRNQIYNALSTENKVNLQEYTDTAVVKLKNGSPTISFNHAAANVDGISFPKATKNDIIIFTHQSIMVKRGPVGVASNIRNTIDIITNAAVLGIYDAQLTLKAGLNDIQTDIQTDKFAVEFDHQGDEFLPKNFRALAVPAAMAGETILKGQVDVNMALYGTAYNVGGTGEIAPGHQHYFYHILKGFVIKNLGEIGTKNWTTLEEMLTTISRYQNLSSKG